jgi:hypothetical protein
MTGDQIKKIGGFFETFVVIVILIALVHTFLEDFSIVAGWTVTARRWIIWAGLGIDTAFTIEFFARLYFAIIHKEAGEYFFRQRGWIDFVASIPLLLLNSLPNTLALLAGAGLMTGLGSFLNVLKVIKAVRIARILRLLRIVKLFRRIRYARSPLAQKHIAIITTIGVTVLVVWVLLSNLLGSLGILPGLEKQFLTAQGAHAQYLSQTGADAASVSARARELASFDSTLLVVRPLGGNTSWTRYTDAYYAANFLTGDYEYFNVKGIESFFDGRPVAQATAREGIVFFVAIVLIVLAYILLYIPRFALDITDPIHVMKRGMEESGYNLEVKIPSRRADEDVFELARLYNSIFLPLKDRGSGQEEQTGVLGINDIRSFVEKE